MKNNGCYYEEMDLFSMNLEYGQQYNEEYEEWFYKAYSEYYSLSEVEKMWVKSNIKDIIIDCDYSVDVLPKTINEWVMRLHKWNSIIYGTGLSKKLIITSVYGIDEFIELFNEVVSELQSGI